MHNDREIEASTMELRAERTGVSIIAAEVYAAAVRTRYLRAGRGPAVVLLHGAAANAEDWRPVIGSLSGHFLVIAPDVAGIRGEHGSAMPPVSPEPGLWLRDFLDGLGLDRVSIVGSREGGVIALRFASEYPDRVERLMLIGSREMGGELPNPFSSDQFSDIQVLMHECAGDRPGPGGADRGSPTPSDARRRTVSCADRSGSSDSPDMMSAGLIRFLGGEPKSQAPESASGSPGLDALPHDPL